MKLSCIAVMLASVVAVSCSDGIRLSTENGILIEALESSHPSHGWLASPEPLFSYVVCQDPFPGGFDTLGRGNSRTPVTDFVKFDVKISHNHNKVSVRTCIENLTDRDIMVQLTMPEIDSLNSISGDTRAMIPYEIGAAGSYGKGHLYGSQPGIEGMPYAFNSAEIAAVYDGLSGQGIYFADLSYSKDNREPLQFSINGTRISARWTCTISAKGKVNGPELTIGTISHGWQEAADIYNKSNPAQMRQDTPAWLKEADAIYSTRQEGTGGAYQCLPGREDLAQNISSFAQLPELLDTARRFGSDILVLVDYYERAETPQWTLPYWNKGEYIPRSDLGGPQGFKDGIKKVHDAGGHVIAYVEPYIIYSWSQIGKEHGEQWAAHAKDGSLDTSYRGWYTMQPANIAWQDEVVRICTELVREYGVDGILLDSVGWQWNRLFYTESEGNLYPMEAYNRALLALCSRVRQSIRKENPEAALLTESGAGRMIGVDDGGFSSDFVWSNQTGTELIVSPLRYMCPGLPLFSAGKDMKSIYRTFALGYPLALCRWWLGHEDEISSLVNIRKTYRDALATGKPHTETQSDGSTVFTYTGTKNIMRIVLNPTTDAIPQGWERLFCKEGTIDVQLRK